MLKIKSSTDAAANGQTSPVDDANKPRTRRVVFPLPEQSAYPQNCAMRNPSPPGQRPACPPAWRGNAQRINYKRMIPQYLGIVNHIVPYLVLRKFFKIF